MNEMPSPSYGSGSFPYTAHPHLHPTVSRRSVGLPMHSDPLSNLCRRRQAHLPAERGEARIVLVAQNEGVIEEIEYRRIPAAPCPIEPCEGLLRIVAQRVDLRDLVGGAAAVLVDQRLECRIGRTPVGADLRCEGEREVLPDSGGLLLRGGERRLSIAALDFDDCEVQVS